MLKYLTDIYKTRQAKNDDEDRTPNLLTTDVQKEIIIILEKFVFFILPDLESEGVDAVEADGIPPMSR